MTADPHAVPPQPARADPGKAIAERVLALAMLGVMLVNLAAGQIDLAPLRLAGWGLMGLAVLLALGLRRLTLREYYLLTLCAGLSLLAFLRADEPVAVLAGALDQAAYLMSFILALGLLNEAASTSPSVAACGLWLTRQPPGRRYWSLGGGTAALAVLFNIGTVSFLVPLIQRGIAQAPDDGMNPIRERRQVSALVRGFAWSVIWSPTAIAPLVVVTLIPGTDRSRWLLIGAAVFVLILAVGALEDRLRFPPRPGRPARVAAPVPWGAVLRFALACGWLFGMSALIARVTGGTIVSGLLLACPVMLLGWIVAQKHGNGGTVAVVVQLTRVLARMPLAAPVAVTLACSGYIGRVAAALVSAPALAQALHLDAVPDFVLLSVIPVALAVLSLLALSPIMMAVFFGSLFGSLTVLPADPTLIAFAISCGWALSMTFSPFATVVLLIDRVAGIAPRQLTWGWNLTFTLIAALVLVPVFAVLTGGR